ncbi:MAG: LysR family transcriptional regulator [Microscillaceae bacterium]|jgi:DNA-binding transcriptional LysR family regulator|nr:LysR family transcriptional regulator [Microscillaceae bacterium]
MDLKVLENFVKLATIRNYRRTAEEVFIAQPALSRQIQLLEAEIGAELFKRSKRSVKLTEAGSYFEQEVSRLLEQFKEVTDRTRQIHAGEAGEIRIGHATSSMQSVLPELLKALRVRFPQLKTTLIEATNLFEINALLHREIDLGFGPNIVTPPEIVEKVIYTENFVLLLPENHHLNQNNFESLAQVAQENFIIPPKSESRGYVETIEAMCQAAGFLPQVAQQSGHSMTVLRLVEAGMGVSIEPKSSLKHLNLRIKSIELNKIPQKVEMKLLWLRERTRDLEKYLKIMDETIQQFDAHI